MDLCFPVANAFHSKAWIWRTNVKIILKNIKKKIEYAKKIQDLSNEQSTILNENRQNKSPELVPINQQRMQLSLEIQDLGALLKDLRGRVAQEKYLGTAPTP